MALDALGPPFIATKGRDESLRQAFSKFFERFKELKQPHDAPLTEIQLRGINPYFGCSGASGSGSMPPLTTALNPVTLFHSGKTRFLQEVANVGRNTQKLRELFAGQAPEGFEAFVSFVSSWTVVLVTYNSQMTSIQFDENHPEPAFALRMLFSFVFPL